jgi:hypothetical protein
MLSERSLLEAALIGHQHQLAQARTAMAGIQKQLGGVCSQNPIVLSFQSFAPAARRGKLLGKPTAVGRFLTPTIAG